MKNCLIVTLGIVSLASSSPRVAAQDPVGVCKDSRGCDDSSNTGSPGGARPGRNDVRRSAALELNEKGVAAVKKGDLAAAVSFFEQALKNSPNDGVIRQNLADARLRVAKAAKAAEEKRDEAQSRVAADKMQQSIQDFAKTLKAAPSTGGLDFDGGNSGIAAGSGVSATSTVVDARAVPSGLSKALDDTIAGAYRNAPAGVADRVRKGFQAVSQRDWNVAKAWFGDALNRDPTNAGLKRLLKLAAAPPQSTKQPIPVTALQLPSDEDVLLLFPGEVDAPRTPRPDDVYYYVPTKGYSRMTVAEAELKATLDTMMGRPVGSIVAINPNAGPR